MDKEKVEVHIKALEIIYEEACYPTHNDLSTEPQYCCSYCNHCDVAPAHAEKCIAIDAVLAAATMREMLAENERLLEKCRIHANEAMNLDADKAQLQNRIEAMEKVVKAAKKISPQLYRDNIVFPDDQELLDALATLQEQQQETP
ncbi:MAG: hypothetical protein FVQ79_00080 [Planctomycetes bacterium]|nr:hypothetical protein [Planctomycetota bacterium]